MMKSKVLVLVLVGGLCSLANAGYYVDTLTGMSGLVSYWDLNETSGNAADSVPGDALDGDNYGIYSGTGYTQGVAGMDPSGGFLGFDADNKAVNFSDDASTKLQMVTHSVYDGSKDLSIITWVQYPSFPGSSSDRRTVGGLQRDASSGKYVFATGFYNPTPQGLQMFARRSDGSSTATTRHGDGAVNEWHMWVITLQDGRYATCYLDGDLKETYDFGNGDYGLDASNGLIFGNDIQVSANRPWKGEMDEIAMFNRALSETEVGTLYDAAFVPEPATLVLLGLGSLALWRRRK